VILHEALKLLVHVTFQMNPMFFYELFLRKPKFLGHTILHVEPGKKIRYNFRTEALGTRQIRGKLWALALLVSVKAKGKTKQ